MIVYQLREQEIPFFLCDALRNPVENIKPEFIFIKIWKPMFSSYGRTQNGSACREIGKGWYAYHAAAVDVDTVGVNLLLAVTSSGEHSVTPFSVILPPS